MREIIWNEIPQCYKDEAIDVLFSVRARRIARLQQGPVIPAGALRFCARCKNRGVFAEQVNGPQNTRTVICTCGTYFEYLAGSRGKKAHRPIP